MAIYFLLRIPYLVALLNLKGHFPFLLNQYLKISKDPDLVKMLPLYKTYCALKQGVKTCEMKVAQQNDELGILAMDYFHLAVRFSRDIPRS